MNALIIMESGKSSCVEHPEPKPAQGGERRLLVKRVGYCGSDLNTFRGFNPLVA
jgi:threonine dehydrogenase-like Zn-dependent dehydrogenase